MTALLRLGLDGDLNSTRRLNQAGWRSRTGEKGASASNGCTSANLGHPASSTASGQEQGSRPPCGGGAGACCPLPPHSPRGLRLGAAESAEGQALAQARFLRGQSSGRLGARKARAGPVREVGRGRGWAAASGSPGDGCAVLLGLHAQGGDARGLAVWLAVELVAVEARAEARRSKQATHVRLAHVTASPGDAQEVGDAAGPRARGVGMRGHAGWHRVAGDHAGRNGGGSPIVANPGRVLNLGRNKGERS